MQEELVATDLVARAETVLMSVFGVKMEAINGASDRQSHDPLNLVGNALLDEWRAEQRRLHGLLHGDGVHDDTATVEALLARAMPIPPGKYLIQSNTPI